MVVLNKITTKTGDDGTSGLATGERRRKSDKRFAAIGTVDETNAVVGIARLHAGAKLEALLEAIQNDLFDLGADLATPETAKAGAAALRITAHQVEHLEHETQGLNASLEPLTSFVLPGGSPGAAHLHQARTLARRAERVMVELSEREKVSPLALQYINRLSDFLFVAARFANDGGRADRLWVPGANREA
jgi:cob(I)alamin adenosyltransferase